MKHVLIIAWFLLTGPICHSQRYITESGDITFFSEAPLEDIRAINSEVSSLFDSGNGEIVYSVQIKGFLFKKSLMQQHFNENYMESDKFPKAIFKGVISGFQNKPGRQEVRAIGELTIHGVTNSVDVPGYIEISAEQVIVSAVFEVMVADYEIEIPSILFSKIAEVVEVTVNLNYKLYEK